MRYHVVCLAGLVLAGLLPAVPEVDAQTSCGTVDFELVSSASVQGLMQQPAQSEGDITSGSLAPGSWTLTFDDTGGPAGAGARRNHIKSFYTYDANAQIFAATFSASQVDLQLVGADLTFTSAAEVILVAPDTNVNGSLSNAELDNQTLSASIDASCASGTTLCSGLGSATGGISLNLVTTPLNGSLDTSVCATPVEPSVRGTIKALFRE
ncbi:MAG: hypothetical protein ACE5G2_05990 [Candidatus Krumholzibacteriia bacterium]